MIFQSSYATKFILVNKIVQSSAMKSKNLNKPPL